MAETNECRCAIRAVPTAMTKLCSILIPSRKGFDRLSKTIRSIIYNANGVEYEILVRMDDDDATGAQLAEINSMPHTRAFSGIRFGWGGIEKYFNELSRIAVGEWIWIAGDDMIVSGPWLEQLRRVPLTGYIVQPAISKLGASVYLRAENQAFPIFPKDCWKLAGHDSIPPAMDVNVSLPLLKIGWETWFLEGVIFLHDQARHGGAETI